MTLQARFRVACFMMLTGLSVCPICAEVKVPALIGDNMVLQAGARIRIWGTAAPGEKVTVSIRGQRGDAVTGPEGQWAVILPVLPAGGPDNLTVVGTNTLTFTNVMVGEVWVCSGQSNMEWPLVQAAHGDQEVERATHPEIRLFAVKQRTATEPLQDGEGKWEVLTPRTAAGFSAVGYFFGRWGKIHPSGRGLGL
jgi:sialate O-acetylesterase